jgi:hypothetical protein
MTRRVFGAAAAGQVLSEAGGCDFYQWPGAKKFCDGILPDDG